jgi:hypothetical protein
MANIRSVIAGTLSRHEPEIVDQITKRIGLMKIFGDKDVAPKLFKMKEPPPGAQYAGGIKLVDDPGRSIVEKIRKGSNSTNAAFERFDLIDTTPQDNFDEVEQQWKSIAGSCNLSNEDLDKNSGSKTRIFDLLEASVDDLVLSQQELLNDYLMGTVPNDAAGRKRPTGLLDWVKDDPTTAPAAGVGVIGANFDPAVYAFWQNQATNHAAAAFGTDQTGTGHVNLRTMLLNCTFGMAHPGIVIAGRAAWLALVKSMVNQARVNDPTINTLVAAGFKAIMFDGVPVVLEDTMDTIRAAAGLNGSAFYALNANTLRIWGMKKRWFKLGDFRAPTNQDSQVALCITRLQMTSRGRRQQGVMFNVV